ncbi:MAG: hypothetical protein FWD25_12915, partial [Clostridia bacterium]|nr:hypothetical protein [Clostridia bacterium]
MEKQNKVKFYQTKVFRALIAIVLAVILLSDSAMQNMASLFASEQEVAQEEVMAPEVAQPGAEQGSGDRDQGSGAKETPDPQPPGDAETELDEDEEEDAKARERATTIARAIEIDGVAYVYANGHVFGDPRLRTRDAVGQVRGVVLTTALNEADAGNPRASVRVAFAIEGALVQGYMHVSAVSLLDYEETIEEIGEDAAREYGSAAWPLPLAGYVAAQGQTADASE